MEYETLTPPRGQWLGSGCERCPAKIERIEIEMSVFSKVKTTAVFLTPN